MTVYFWSLKSCCSMHFFFHRTVKLDYNIWLGNIMVGITQFGIMYIAPTSFTSLFSQSNYIFINFVKLASWANRLNRVPLIKFADEMTSSRESSFELKMSLTSWREFLYWKSIGPDDLCDVFELWYSIKDWEINATRIYTKWM